MNYSSPWTYRKSKMIVDAAQTNSERNTGYGAYKVCQLGDSCGSDFHEDELHAFGYLIAAAPDLLKACKMAMEDEVCRDTYLLLKNAVEKAEGK